MVGEHTIRPRQLESVTPTLKVSEELERERLRQQEIADESSYDGSRRNRLLEA